MTASATAPAGLVKVNLVSLTMVSGIFGAPLGLSPPRFTAARALLVEEVDHRQGREPGPVDRDRSTQHWLTELTEIFAPIGADTALLLRV